MSKEKILMLNSGGFDSVVLCYYLKETKPEAEIISLFFDYGQQSLELEKVCAKKVCNKLGYRFREIVIPEFSWTKSNFYGPDLKDDASQELEYRNLIFLSYAASIASSQGCSSIYLALLKSSGYADTSKEFIQYVDNILSLKGIKLVAPFKDFYKKNLIPWVFNYKLTTEDFCSCDTPIDGKPCGECPDCTLTDEIINLCNEDTPINNWLRNSDPKDIKFQKSIENSKIKSVKLFIEKQEGLITAPLLVQDFTKIIDGCVRLGISNFCISGNKCLENKIIFELVKYTRDRYPNVTYEVCTNGEWVLKYAELIKNLGFKKVYLNIEDSCELNSLKFKNSLREIEKWELPCQVVIDLYSNYQRLDFIIRSLYIKYNIKDFHIREVYKKGKRNKRLSLPKVNKAYKLLNSLEDLPIELTLSLGAFYVYDFLEHPKYILTEAISDSLCYLEVPSTNLKIHPEIFCEKYINQIIVTYDGYVLGCENEISHTHYDKISAGNVRNKDMSEIINKGKRLCIQCNLCQQKRDGSLKFYKCIHKPLDD